MYKGILGGHSVVLTKKQWDMLYRRFSPTRWEWNDGRVVEPCICKTVGTCNACPLKSCNRLLYGCFSIVCRYTSGVNVIFKADGISWDPRQVKRVQKALGRIRRDLRKMKPYYPRDVRGRFKSVVYIHSVGPFGEGSNA